MATRKSGEVVDGGAVRHLVRAVEQHEAALAELKEHIRQCESSSSFLSSLFSPCGHRDHSHTSSASSSSPSASPPFCSTSLHPRVFVPLTSQALLPGFLLPSSAPPLLHLGESYLATFHLGVPPESDQSSSSPSKEKKSADASGKLTVQGLTSRPSSDNKGKETASLVTNEGGCGALGLLGRREQLLKAQEGDIQDRLRKLKTQLGMATSPAGEFSQSCPGENFSVSGDSPSSLEGSSHNTKVKGRAHITKDGFIEIIEEYESEEEEGKGPPRRHAKPFASQQASIPTPDVDAQAVLSRRIEDIGTQRENGEANSSVCDAREPNIFPSKTTPHDRIGKERLGGQGKSNSSTGGPPVEETTSSMSVSSSSCVASEQGHDKRIESTDPEQFLGQTSVSAGFSAAPIRERIFERTADSCSPSAPGTTKVPRSNAGHKTSSHGSDNAVVRERETSDGSVLDTGAKQRPSSQPAKRDCSTGEDTAGSSATQGKKVSLFKALRQQQTRD
ncbi:hypothetical protein CSUI_000166 [Cystoisospora suis]|uniref:Uncharacterized protein n=1 Tax=Cystoisospora suis TaxID=483139 RepID=A0A2C6LD90_9APIC|nr:hypothetical protein CSUI_000166 [Cystoisospora suis]